MQHKFLTYIRILRNKPLWFIRKVLSRILILTGLSTLFTIRLGGSKLKFFPTTFSADLWFPLENRTIMHKYSLPFLKPGDTVIDIGANIGFTTLLFKRFVGNMGKVFAFEPNPTVFNFLKANIALNKIDNVLLFNYAVGEKRGKMFLADNKKDDTSNAITHEKDNGFVISIDCLDSLLKDFVIKTVHLLKIDTEGYEKFVLLGAKSILAKTRVIIFEGKECLCRQFNYNLGEVVDLLESSGFFVYGFNKETNKFEMFDIGNNLNKIYFQDFFAVRDHSVMKGVTWL